MYLAYIFIRKERKLASDDQVRDFLRDLVSILHETPPIYSRLSTATIVMFETKFHYNLFLRVIQVYIYHIYLAASFSSIHYFIKFILPLGICSATYRKKDKRENETFIKYIHPLGLVAMGNHKWFSNGSKLENEISKNNSKNTR